MDPVRRDDDKDRMTTLRRTAIADAADNRQDRLDRRRFGPVARIAGQGREPEQMPGAAVEPAHGISTMQAMIAAFEPVGNHHDDRAMGKAGKARIGEKGFERRANAGAAIPIGDEIGGACRALSPCS